MTTFIVLAGLMAAAAIAVVAWPFLKARREEGRSAVGMAVLLAVGIVVGAFLLYGTWSDWNWDPAAREAAAQNPEAHEMGKAVADLEARLAKEPGDVEGWMLLGRTRLVMDDFPGAAEAYGKAHELTGGANAESTANYGEALALVDPNALDGRAGELFEAALRTDPANQKALWYGGLRALRTGDAKTARDRWTALVAQDPPAEVKQILEQRIAELDAQLGGPMPAAARPPAAGAVAPAGTAAAGSAAAPTTPGRPGEARVRVTLSPQFAGQVPAGTPLFVLARDPSQPGPPLAAQRIVDPKLPLEIVLTDANAMAPGRTISTAKQLEIVARYSKGGMPMAATGDLYGQGRIDVATWQAAEIVIDRRVP